MSINSKQIMEFINNSALGILILRLFIGVRLVYGVMDNVISWGKMLEFSKFLETNQFSLPIISAIVSVYVQLVFGLCVLFGFKTRLAALILILNFLIALFVHLKLGDSVERMTPALAMLFGCLTLLFTDAEKLSIDHYLSSFKK